MSGTHFLHFSGRLGLHGADLHGVYLNGSIRVGDGRYYDSTTVSFVGTAGLSHAYGLSFFMFYQFSVLFMDSAIINWCHPSLRPSWSLSHKSMSSARCNNLALPSLDQIHTMVASTILWVFWRFRFWGVSNWISPRSALLCSVQ